MISQHAQKVRKNGSDYFAQALLGFTLALTTLTELAEADILYCHHRENYYGLNRTWTDRCNSFNCTLSGVVVSQTSYPPCDNYSRNSSFPLQQACEMVTSENELGCCQRFNCPDMRIKEQQSRGPPCPKDWIEVNGTPEWGRDYPVCMKASSLTDTFETAARKCRKESSSLPRDDIFNEKNMRYFEDIFGNGTFFWIGLHSVEGRFYWDTSQQLLEADFTNCCSDALTSSRWSGWDCGEPLQGKNCARARLVNDRILFSSADCEESLPYICSRPRRLNERLTDMIIDDSLCPQSWIFSKNTRKCYKFFESGRSHNAFGALQFCQDFNATLATGVDLYHLGAMAGTIPGPKEVYAGICLSNDSDAFNCSQETSLLAFRSRNATKGWRCVTFTPVLSGPEIEGLLSFSSCFRKLPYLCQKSPEVQSGLNLEVKQDAFCKFSCEPNGVLTAGNPWWIKDGIYGNGDDYVVRRESQFLSSSSHYQCYATDYTTGERIISQGVVTGEDLEEKKTCIIKGKLRAAQDLSRNCTGHVFGNSLPLQILPHLSLPESVQMPGSPEAPELKMQGIQLFLVCRVAASPFEVEYFLEVSYAKTLSRSRRNNFLLGRACNRTPAYPSDMDNPSNPVALCNQVEQLLRSPSTVYVGDTPHDSLTVVSAHFCPPKRIYNKQLGNLTVPTTTIGTWFNVSLCLSSGYPMVALYCKPDFLQGPAWVPVFVDECEDKINSDQQELRKISLEKMSLSTAMHLIKRAINITNGASRGFDLTSSDIIDVARIVNNALDMTVELDYEGDLLTLQLVGAIPALVSRVMNAAPSQIAIAEATTRASTTLTMGLQELLDKVPRLLNESQTIQHFEDNVAFKVTSDAKLVGIGVLDDAPLTENSVLDIRTDNDALSHTLFAQLTLSPRLEGNLGKTFTVYRNSKLFMGKSWRMAAEAIVSASINRPSQGDYFDDLVRVKYINLENFSANASACGFWSYKDDDWSTKGCTMLYATDKEATCSCDHTTSFAVLMRHRPISPEQMIHEHVLTWLTNLGLGISIASLMVVLLTFLLFKKMRQTASQKVLVSLASSLLSLDVVFLVGVDRTESEVGCIIVAMLLHYFLLTSFAWMGVEAVLQYLRFVKVLGAYVPRFMLKSSIPAWGLPALIVGVISAKDYKLYMNDENICWVQNEIVYYGVMLPVALVMTFNAAVFGFIMRSLMCTKGNVTLRSNQSESQIMKLHLRAAIAILVVMGLTWVFGFLTIIKDAGVFFQYLFCICNSLQGFLILCFHCVREKTVQVEWRKLFNCKKAASKKDEFSFGIINTLASAEHKSTPGTLLTTDE